MGNINIKDFIDYKYLSNLTVSPDENNMGFVISQADFEANSYKSYIWIMDTKTKESRKLTANGKEGNILWLDSKNIMFSSLRDDAIKAKIEQGEDYTVYYKINIEGGEAEEFMKIPMQVTSIKALSGEKYIITANYDNNGIDLHGLKGEEREAAVKLIKENKDYEVIDEIPFWFNGKGFTNKMRNRLYIYDKANDTLKAITDNLTDVNSFVIKEDKVLFVANRYTDMYDGFNSLNIYDISKDETSTLIEQSEYGIGYADFIEDKIILTLTDKKILGINQNKDIYLFEDGELNLLLKHDTGFGSSVGSDCKLGAGKSTKVIGDTLYFISTIGKSSFINTLNLKGEHKILTADCGSIDCIEVASDDVFFVGLRGQKLQEIYIVDEERQLSTFNEDFYATKNVVVPEYFVFTNNDGIEIDGFIMKPVDFDENKKYPAILDIHGGPKTVYGEVFYHEMQTWANLGYFVIFSNPRGGDGKGDAFSDIRGKYGTIDYDDLMQFTDICLEKYPAIDDKNIGVTGGSYGGFMTNWIIGHTDRFKCAVSQRSISNWISKFCTTDIGYYFNSDQNQSTPWENHDKLWWHSPLKYADKATTPTLFIHSEEDYRCWLPEGLQMFTALKYHGIESRLCMFRGENHELSRGGKPKHRLRRLEEMTSWFEKYLKKA